tara:strand:+ start:1062 stop:1856 length:795 start_codon:yes stop_codon:yes gene_type:complete
MKRNNQEGTVKDTLSFIASTSGVDRYGDIIDQKGWNLTNYRNNPVVLLNHDSNSLPIGRGEVEVKNGKLNIDVTFDMKDERAKEIARKAKDGFLNAVSVGFKPLESKSRYELSKDSPFYGEKGMFYSKAELLEVSLVTIPANGEAIMNQKDFNILKNQVVEEVRDVLYRELFNQPEIKLRHIIAIRDEEDKIVIEFAKAKDERAMEEEEEDKAMEEEEEEKSSYKEEEEDKAMEEEEEDKAVEEDEEKEKDFYDYISLLAKSMY